MLTLIAGDDTVDAFVFRSRWRNKTEFAKRFQWGLKVRQLGLSATRSTANGAPTSLVPFVLLCGHVSVFQGMATRGTEGTK
jgi:hypothetical protein